MCGNVDQGRLVHMEQKKDSYSPGRPCFDGKMSPVLLIVVLANAMAVCVCELSQPCTDATDGCFVKAADPVSHIFQTSDLVFQLVNKSFSFSRAWHHCQSQFSSLTALGEQEDEEGERNLLNHITVNGPIWVRMDNKLATTSTSDNSKQSVTLSALSFPGESQDGYARVQVSFPPLPAVSVCLRAQFDPHHVKVSTLFSYAAPVFTNEFQLRGYVDKAKQQVMLALIIHGKHHSYKAWFPNDAGWHHVCITWRKRDEFWAIYVDGERRDWADGVTSRDIHGNGILILGQDQDSFGGNFTEPFFGNLTDVNVWEVSLDEKQIKLLDVCLPPLYQRPFFSWQERNLSLHEVVKEVPVMMNCPVLKQREHESCRVVDVRTEGEAHYSTAPCSHTFPFICKTSTDRFLKKKELDRSLAADPSPFMQHLLENGMTSGEEFDGPDADDIWFSVSHLLNVSEQYLRESEEPLDSRDVPSLLHMLSHAAELPVTENRSHADAHALSKSFIGLADMLISEENAEKWEAIREVVSGPMSVVQTIDRMATNLSPLLLEETDSVKIHCSNIKLQVQQRSVTESSRGSEFCGSDSDSLTHRDCITLPLESIKELQNNGFSKVTLLNTWYSSLTPLLNRDLNVTLQPIISDGSLKYLGTVLASSLISSTVVGDGQLISIGVNYTLQHRTQNNSGTVYNPICAFWDFSLTPELGGGWSTEGCQITSLWQNSTSCYCNHTTNFALLLQIYDVQWSQNNEKGLQILSFIGCGVSLCGLTFTFILFIAVGVPKSDRTTVHKNLIFALAVAQLLLIFSYWASANQEVCLLVTALLHLFFLSSFCWMLVEGLLLWSKVVSVNISEDRRMRFYYALGWGLPAVIVAVTLTVSLNKYKAEHHCWLNTQSDIIWAFVGPVLFVLAVNTVVLCRVVMVTVSSARRRAKMLAPSSASKPHAFDLTWAATRPVLILLPVLGLTWLCGVLVHLSVVLAYMFIILNAFQGLYIFLVYAVYNSEVQNAIKRIQEKRKALSFTNCSQPISFLSSQRTPGASWVDSLPPPSSPESSSYGSNFTNSTASSLVFKNESFGNDSFVSFSLKPSAGTQVVQLMAFKPSAC